MKRTLLRFFLLAGMLTFSAAAVYAETLEGVITAIDSEKNILNVAPLSPEGTVAAEVRVSVMDFVRVKGPALLNDLDIGKKVTMAVRKRKDGTLEMVALKKPDRLVPAPAKEGQYLEVKGPPAASATQPPPPKKEKWSEPRIQ